MIVMDVRSAELTKYAANAMLATKISFMNEIANLAERMGADIEKVRVGIGSDPRIGYSFIYPGAGYGGSCFPKDVKALVHSAGEHNFDAQLLRAVEAVNKNQKRVVFRKMHDYFGGKLKGKTVALWGLAFKPNTDDMREAPARELMEALWAAGATVRAYDPVAMGEAERIYGQRDDLKLVADADGGARRRRCAGDHHGVAGIPQPGLRHHSRQAVEPGHLRRSQHLRSGPGEVVRTAVFRHRPEFLTWESNMLTPLILSGGSGTRLWPLSREMYPKQLLPLIGKRTMLQETVARVSGLPDLAAPIVVCNEKPSLHGGGADARVRHDAAGNHPRAGRPQYGAGRRGGRPRRAGSRAQEQGRQRCRPHPARAAR